MDLAKAESFSITAVTTGSTNAFVPVIPVCVQVNYNSCDSYGAPGSHGSLQLHTLGHSPVPAPREAASCNAHNSHILKSIRENHDSDGGGHALVKLSDCP